MTDNLQSFKNLLKTIIVSLIIAAPTAFIGFYIVHIFQTPEVQITILQFNHLNEKYAKTFGIVQNMGTGSAKDLLLVFNYPNKYQLIGFNSTEHVPKIINNTDGILRVSLDRLSPQSYVIFELKSNSSEHSSSQIWLTSDGDTKSLIVPYEKTNFGISTESFSIPGLSSLGIETIMGIIFFITIRYLLYTKSESLRRDYLGVYDIRITKFNFPRIAICCVIILGFLIAAIITVNALEPNIHPTSYISFPIYDVTTVNEFIKIQNHDPSYQDPANTGYFILFIGIAVAVGYSIRDIELPTFIWLLKPSSISTVKLNKISLSYYKVKAVTLDYKIESDDSKFDFFAIKINDKISGLLSRKELGDKPTGKTIQHFLTKDYISSPEWNDVSLHRDNFYLAKDVQTLGEIKVEMEKNIKKYAVVIDSNKELLGVLDYQSIFKNEGN